MSDCGGCNTGLDPGGGGGGSPLREQFTYTSGPVSFTLAVTPITTDSIFLFLRGIQYNVVDDWTIVGNVITWLNNTPLIPGDIITIYYGEQ